MVSTFALFSTDAEKEYIQTESNEEARNKKCTEYLYSDRRYFMISVWFWNVLLWHKKVIIVRKMKAANFHMCSSSIHFVLSSLYVCLCVCACVCVCVHTWNIIKTSHHSLTPRPLLDFFPTCEMADHWEDYRSFSVSHWQLVWCGGFFLYRVTLYSQV